MPIKVRVAIADVFIAFYYPYLFKQIGLKLRSLLILVSFHEALLVNSLTILDQYIWVQQITYIL